MACIKKDYADRTPGRTICFAYLVKYLRQMWRRLPCVPEVYLAWFPMSVMSVLWSASLLVPPFYFRPPRARKILWYPGQVARDILSACIKTAFGRIMRPDIVVQMRDNSRKRTVCFCTSWKKNWGLCSFDSSFCRSIIRLRSCDDNWSQLAFLEGFYFRT